MLIDLFEDAYMWIGLHNRDNDGAYRYISTGSLKVRLSENVFMKSSFGQNTNENISEISVLYCL